MSPVHTFRPVVLLAPRRLRAKTHLRAQRVESTPPGPVPRLDPASGASVDSTDAATEPLAFLDRRWQDIPGRYRLVALCSAAFVLCNMDKVNLSLAIIPMARTFDWSAGVSGLVQSSFFWGYMAFQIPGGYLCSRFGGRRVIPFAVGLWSFATAAIPFIGGTVPGLCLARAAVGLGEAVAPSAITDMVARTVPASERSRATSFIFAGLSVGSVLGLLFSAALIDVFGWESVFVLFAVGGAGWIYAFKTENFAGDVVQPSAADEGSEIPLRGILRSSPVWALAFTHFCANYFHYTMLTWLPSYFSQTLHLDLSQAALVSVFPPVLSISAAGIAGSLADKLIETGFPTTQVRKLCQSVAFLGPATCLVVASCVDDARASAAAVTLSLGLAAFSMAGLYCNHQDLSPKYSSFLIGLTNTAASVPGIVGVWLTGYLMDAYGRWEVALFLPSIFFFLAGTAVFLKYGTSEEQSFADD